VTGRGATREAYGLRADIGVPEARGELHDWRPEGVVVGYADVDNVLAPLVRRVRGPLELPF